MTVLETTAAIDPAGKRRALQQVLQSQTFSRSDQLKRFLRYICEKEIAGRAEEINEYSIGIEALGKPPGYSPGDDSSVRTRAYALRQKLQEFYEQEQPHAEVRIEVPKGSYTPYFFAQALPTENFAAAIPRAEPPQTVPPKASPLRPFLAGVAAAAALFGTILFSFQMWRGRTISIDSLVREAWGELLNRGEHVDVCVATPPALLLHSYHSNAVPASPRLLPAPPEVTGWYQGLRMMDGGGTLYMHTTQDAALVGDALAAASALHLLSSAGAQPQIVREMDLRPIALRGKDVILIGSPNYSPFAGRVLQNTPFSVRYDPSTREEVISEDPDKPGAKLVFRPTRNSFGQRSSAYGLITVFPSQQNATNGPRTVIFSGITSAGPQAAMEFFKSPEGLRELRNQLKKGGYSHFPASYQVVVRCDMDQNLALNWAYVTHRVLDDRHLLN